jgi:hypothetical protein
LWSDWSDETLFRTVATGSLSVPEGLRAAGGARSAWFQTNDVTLYAPSAASPSWRLFE